MNENPDIEYFIWLDSDAFFINFENQRFQEFLKKNDQYSMITTKDMPPWSENFNAGSFIIKNDEIGKSIIQEWISKYNPNNWQYTDSKWHTDSVWAGDDYEQGAFKTHILENPRYNHYISNLPYYHLNNNNCEQNINDSLIVHLAGEHKTNTDTLNKCLKTFQYEKIEGFELYEYEYNYSFYYFLFFSFLIFLIFFFKKIKMFFVFPKKIGK
jgi:hypothetical protein